MWIVLGSFLIGLGLSQASAETRTPVMCAALQSDTARLACYDSVYAEHRAAEPETTSAEPAAPAPRPSRWTSRTTRSQIDDSARVILSVESTDSIPGRFGAPGPAQLMIRCEENTTSLYIHFNGLFMSDIQGYGIVNYRIDDRPAGQVTMSDSTNHEALGLWRGSRSIPLVRELFGGDELFIRATPYSENRVEMTFPISGLEDAIGPLRSACNW